MVPLDGSAFAERALPHALAVARRKAAPLHLVTVHQTVAAPAGNGFDATYDPRWYLATAAGQRDYLEKTAGQIAGGGLHVVVSVLHGSVVPALLRYTKAERAALLVMATHGRGGVTRMWIGSVLDGTLRRAPLPILVVRSWIEPGTEPSLARMLIPLDGSELAEQALPPALALGSLFGCEYRLLRVVPTPYTMGSRAAIGSAQVDGDALRRGIAQAERHLKDLGQRLSSEAAHRVSTRVIEASGQAIAEAIAEAARSTRAELIALATHGRGGVKRAILGSVADELIRSTDLPLLVVRPRSGLPKRTRRGSASSPASTPA